MAVVDCSGKDGRRGRATRSLCLLNRSFVTLAWHALIVRMTVGHGSKMQWEKGSTGVAELSHPHSRDYDTCVTIAPWHIPGLPGFT